MLTIEEQVIAVVRAVLSVPAADPIGRDSNLANDLGMDSLDVLELAFEIEAEFELDPIPEAHLEPIQTVGQLVDYVTGRLTPPPPGA